jgi:lipoyl(octanoyl) transferase
VNIVVRELGLQAYQPCWQAMKAFTDSRDARTDDEMWVVEHPSVFTLGKAAKREHLLAPGDIEVIPTDRGGQVTYHGPGQLLVYTLLDVRRVGIGPRELVRRLEQAVIDYLAELQIVAQRRDGAPGVYVGDAKIAALGLRIRKGCSYHGIALNVAMDLEPYQRINPCGYAGLKATQLSSLGGPDRCKDVSRGFVASLAQNIFAALPVSLSYSEQPHSLGARNCPGDSG